MYKALKSFFGVVTMSKGEVKAITDKSVVADLISAGYIEEVAPEKKTETKPVRKTAKKTK